MRRGSLRLFPISDLERWLEENSSSIVDDISQRQPQRKRQASAPATGFGSPRRRRRVGATACGLLGSPPNAEEEYLCDVGAAALLMPSDLVAGRYSLDKGLDSVERLARDAKVSL